MITQQYEELKAERDALVAQAKALKDLAEFWINQAKPFQPSEQEYKTWLALGYESKALRSSPQQHLAEIRAEAIECELDAIGAPATKFENQNDYFVAGFNYCAALLQRRAAKLRQGGAV